MNIVYLRREKFEKALGDFASWPEEWRRLEVFRTHNIEPPTGLINA